MVLLCSKPTLLHTALANISHELTTLDDIIRSPARSLPTELLLIIRTHLLATLITQFFADSTHALAEYERNLQHLLCSDCISYNNDIYGPDVWEWQQFSGPCNCVPTVRGDQPVLRINPLQFVNPLHWLEHHLSLRVARISPTTSSIWDAVAAVLRRHHCELLREDLDDFTVQAGPHPTSAMSVFYYRRTIDYGSPKRSPFPPTIRIQTQPSGLRLLEERGIGEVGDHGDTLRADIILHRASRELGLDLEFNDVFSSPREPGPHTFSWSTRKHSDQSFRKFALLKVPTSSSLRLAYSFCSAVFGTLVSVPLTVATVALTVICFYSRPIALRVGV